MRHAKATDASLLRQCLLAEAWVEEMLEYESDLIGGWGRTGDGGVVVVSSGDLDAAAWFRMFERAPGEIGFIDASTPVLTNAWVAPSLRGQGLGSAVLTELMDECQRQGHDALSVATDQTNPAVRLYSRLGFEIVSVVQSRWVLLRQLS